MRYHWVRLKITLLSVFLVVAGLQAQTFPERSSPPKLVNDFADMLSSQEEQILEQKLVAFDDSTSNQISIVTLADLDGEPASSYAPQLAEAWGIGDKTRNNGILILVSMGNPREVFISTGYGVEEFVPDALAKRIVDEHILPAFKKKNYFDGLNTGSDDLMQLLKGTFKGFGKKKKAKSIPAVFVVLGIIVFVMFASRNRGGGGGFRTYGRPGWGGFPMGGGGWHSGGGSSGGGGFGGFGGGSFGGGGAGGSW